MAVRALRSFCLLLLLFGLTCQPLPACFGPKLFVATPSGTEADLLYAMVTLYVQEKTGVESVRVELAAGDDPGRALTEERADLAFVAVEQGGADVIFSLEGYAQLAAGSRPVEELQFTTVIPAIKKLNGLVQPEDMLLLLRQVDAGESAMTVVRKLFMQRRWI